MRAIATPLPGVLVIEPDIYKDDRGFFLETFSRRRYRELGIEQQFVQDNESQSRKGVLRGIHYQDLAAPMAKLVRCSAGAILDVAVDLRVGSATFAKWCAVETTAANFLQVYIPVGFGHAFLVLSDEAEVEYKCTGYYSHDAERVIAWNDPDVGIDWPETSPTLSSRDASGMSLADYLREPAFRYPLPDPRHKGEGESK